MDMSGRLPGDGGPPVDDLETSIGEADIDYGTRLSEIFFPVLAEWRSVLARLSVPPEVAFQAAALAKSNNADFASTLLAFGVREHDLVVALAADLGLSAVHRIDPARLVISDDHAGMLLRNPAWHVPVKLLEIDGGVSFLITQQRIRPDLVRARLRTSPGLAARLKIAGSSHLRAAIVEKTKPALSRTAVSGLFDRFPQMSARFVANAWQGTILGMALAILPVGLLLAPTAVMAILHGLATFFFFACISLRFAAIASLNPAGKQAAVETPPEEAPLFSVLVALYREAEMVPNLLAALDRLVWPRHRLEIKLVCEADDAPTLAAIRAHDLPRHVEVVEVPPGLPRTKPKALAYALQLTGGAFLTLYDAEDEPHPLQLVEAWRRFSRSGPELAVVQAPLEISNRKDGAITRMFAFEYAGLFRGLLPWLSKHRLMLPLGGTSNHFRRAALDHVGGWDPYNVTEDADLGMRLARFGYRAETITLPTFETAPNRIHVWLPQRTRWFKGWAQTWLVHMRDPLGLATDLGPASFIVAQILFAGMLASAMLHPLLLATLLLLVLEFLSAKPLTTFGSALLLFDVANVACGYLSFLLLGWQTLKPGERIGFWKVVLLTPPYWVLLSFAGWRAVWQLWRRPHLWEKTPHEARRRWPPSAMRHGPLLTPPCRDLNRPAGPVRR